MEVPVGQSGADRDRTVHAQRHTRDRQQSAPGQLEPLGPDRGSDDHGGNRAQTQDEEQSEKLSMKESAKLESRLQVRTGAPCSSNGSPRKLTQWFALRTIASCEKTVEGKGCGEMSD